MHTKLRHVDINRRWMRQEVNAGRIHIHWFATADMLADGLTNVLPRQRQKQQRFRELHGIKEIRHRIVPREGISSSRS